MGSMIFTEPRDPRLIAVRRGGTLSDADHRLLAEWAAVCAAHVLEIFEAAAPGDDRVRHALEQNRAWVRGELTMREALRAANARAAAREVAGGAKFAAYAAAQAVAVAHVAAHELGARRLAVENAVGSASSFPTLSGNWCSMTSGCAIMCAGSCSSADWFELNCRAAGKGARQMIFP